VKWSLSRVPFTGRCSIPHANAPLTERGRLRLAQCVVDQGWPLRRAAERFQFSATIAKRWADRYRTDGPTGMSDRPGRPDPTVPATNQ
jgi:transposase